MALVKRDGTYWRIAQYLQYPNTGDCRLVMESFTDPKARALNKLGSPYHEAQQPFLITGGAWMNLSYAEIYAKLCSDVPEFHGAKEDKPVQLDAPRPWWKRKLR